MSSSQVALRRLYTRTYTTRHSTGDATIGIRASIVHVKTLVAPCDMITRRVKSGIVSNIVTGTVTEHHGE